LFEQIHHQSVGILAPAHLIEIGEQANQRLLGRGVRALGVVLALVPQAALVPDQFFPVKINDDTWMERTRWPLASHEVVHATPS
jgi:hypothetical protein